MKKLLLLALLAALNPARAEIYDIEQLDLKNFQGKVVYLDFWASWCQPCRKSFPWMNTLLQRYPGASFAVVTINLDAESQAMHRFLDRVRADFDVYHDPGGRIAEQFQLEGMPTSYLIDASGRVVRKHIGFYESRVEQYQREIEALL